MHSLMRWIVIDGICSACPEIILFGRASAILGSAIDLLQNRRRRGATNEENHPFSVPSFANISHKRNGMRLKRVFATFGELHN